MMVSMSHKFGKQDPEVVDSEPSVTTETESSSTSSPPSSVGSHRYDSGSTFDSSADEQGSEDEREDARRKEALAVMRREQAARGAGDESDESDYEPRGKFAALRLSPRGARRRS